MFSLLEKVAATSQKSKSLLGNIWHHDVAERMRIRRKAIAESSGLADDWDVGTYPPYQMPRTSWVAGAALATAALATGAIGAYALGGLMQSTETERIVETTVERQIDVGIEIIPPEEDASDG